MTFCLHIENFEILFWKPITVLLESSPWAPRHSPHEVWGKGSKQGKALVKGLLRKDPQELRPLSPELRSLT